MNVTGKQLAASSLSKDEQAQVMALFINEAGKLNEAASTESELLEAARKRIAWLRQESTAANLLAPPSATRIMIAAAAMLDAWLRERGGLFIVHSIGKESQ